MVARTTGKNADRKMRKIGEASPTPNQRIAKGIHAKGERFRKKLTIGRNAVRTICFCPIQRPAGMPAATANPNPQVTRNSEVIRSVNRRPVRASSPNARRTSRGAGNALIFELTTPRGNNRLILGLEQGCHHAVLPPRTGSGLQRPLLDVEMRTY